MGTSFKKINCKNDFYTNVDEDYKIGSLIGSSYIPNTPHLTKLSGKDGNISDIEDKTNISYYFNDTYSYSENLTLSFLAKLDDFKEFDSAKSFKLGTVYSNDNKIYINLFYQNLAKHHLLWKIQWLGI